MTLDDLRSMDREFLTPAEVGAVLGCDPQSIRVQAATEPWRLGTWIQKTWINELFRGQAVFYEEGETPA